MPLAFGFSELFTPSAVAAAVSGGALLGCSVLFKTGVLSGVLGVSTYTRRLMVQAELKRYAFTLGMILAGLVMSFAYGGIEPHPPASFSGEQRTKLFVRVGIGAFFLGLGSTLQNGCTSGHGLTGLALLSLRSWVAVPTFMAAGIVTASLTEAAKSFPPDAQTEADVPEWYIGAAVAAGLAAVLACLAAVCRCAGGRNDETTPQVTMLLGEFVVGLTFGCGLVISGMARPSKVASFLDVAHGAWDVSLAFVMGGALLITFPYFQAVERFGVQEKSFLHASSFDLPPTAGKMPDRRLVFGAICFGFGWGLSGVCPGPLWVNVGGSHSLEVLFALVGMFAGIGAIEALDKLLDPGAAVAGKATKEVDDDGQTRSLMGTGEEVKSENRCST